VTPCQLHCKPEGKSFSVMLSDAVIDGTPCHPGTRDMCVNGKCRVSIPKIKETHRH
jgi:thrombospondin motif-containing protein 7/thrombospondin motif-containing protein 12